MAKTTKPRKRSMKEILDSLEGTINFNGDGAALVKALRKNPNMDL